MDLLKQLEIYINAQKGVGLNAIIFGSGLLITAVLFYFYGYSSISNGIRFACVAIGILLLTMGFGLRITQENILKEKAALFEKDPIEFKKIEIERMTKVKNNYPKGQTVMVLLAISAMIAFLFIKSPFWQGVSLIVTVFFVGNIIIEAFSNLAITAYYEHLIN
jgi:hypothetical protein